jgi:hypothetical protein
MGYMWCNILSLFMWFSGFVRISYPLCFSSGLGFDLEMVTKNAMWVVECALVFIVSI